MSLQWIYVHGGRLGGHNLVFFFFFLVGCCVGGGEAGSRTFLIPKISLDGRF